jgi:hypothetical protein
MFIDSSFASNILGSISSILAIIAMVIPFIKKKINYLINNL